ncbi:hypothetical protein Rxycam_03123 [Rubrobacter xylanophilus DSM 9941]|uniref:alpha/beta hydrolase n=1 Tax=Rubrobacter xylanophilus TaxID=49319 RepID=UPI001C63C636|nr:alpha/beta fold hydrolase [Rubrobacter xylanophilus]QYJ17281.1 hypothetical protein Rxycam_03123 [Rubrobacter xylanophilus DSM 9941]
MSAISRTGLVLGAPAALAAGSALAAWVAVRRVVTPAPPEERFVTPWEMGIPHEEVSFETEDGLVLRGWWLENPSPLYTVITLAGHNGARHHTLGIASSLWRRGASVLLFDNRGRGESEGSALSLGYFERLDARAAVEYVLRRAPGSPLGLVGYSMGAAVAIMVAADDPRIGAVVADSPFASQRRLLRALISRRVGPLGPPAAALAERLLPYDVGEVEPLREVGRISPRAILLVHGLSDSTTDPEDSRRLYEAAGEPKELWLLEGVGHCNAYFVDRTAYCERVASFLERHLPPRAATRP